MSKIFFSLLAVLVGAVTVPDGRGIGPGSDAAQREASTVRRTVAGNVDGFLREGDIAVWLGVPFAEPPIGALRWREPRSPAPWSGTRDAKQAGAPCVQMATRLTADRVGPNRSHAGSEDCLYLNVYAPRDAADLPVMVWVHGGGNTVGHGAPYDGAKLAATHNVVVVTINYRLGLLGWFSHPALETGSPAGDSGNYGTLDIVRALEWVRENIDVFGGDPMNVTLFGQSAGGTNTLSMVVSPLADGLFHRAIVQSGGLNITPMAVARNPVDEGGHPNSSHAIVNRLLVRDGTSPDLEAAGRRQAGMTPLELRDYLLGKSADELYDLFDNAGFGVINVPTLMADGYVLPGDSVETLLSDAEKHNSVPMILGSNRDEPSRFLAMNPGFVKTQEGERRFVDEGRFLRAVKYGALAWKERGVDRLANYLTASGNRHVYAYRFDWDEEGVDQGFDLSKAVGAGHSLEIAFVFGDFSGGVALGHLYEASEQKHALAASMMSYWAEFAYNGDPGRGRDGEEPAWLPWGPGNPRSIVLDTPADQGIFMMDELVTREAIKQAIANDPEIDSQRERCELYLRVFMNDTTFDRDEYESFGPEGCAAFEPGEIVL